MDIDIYDKDGNKLHFADLVYHFLKERIKDSPRSIEDVFIGVDVGFPEGKTPIWIYTVESEDNGYDAIELNEFGMPIKTTI